MATQDRSKAISLTDINRFLQERRIAFVGVSKDSQDFTRRLLEQFVRRGYDVVPVNPSVTEIDGRACVRSISEASAPVKAALLLTSPSVTDAVVRECADAGVEVIWMYRAAGAGAVSEAAVNFCHERGITVIAGECPLMFLSDAAFPHRVHGFIRRLCGTYPR